MPGAAAEAAGAGVLRESIEARVAAGRAARGASTEGDSHAARGSAFEAAALEALEGVLGAALERTGQAYDRGVDMRGEWRGVRVAVQCKTERRPLGALHLREMQGVLMQERDGTLGIFVSGSAYTAEAERFFTRMETPCALVRLEEAGASLRDAAAGPPRLAELRLNRAAKRLLPGLVVGRRFEGAREAVEPLWLGEPLR